LIREQIYETEKETDLLELGLKRLDGALGTMMLPSPFCVLLVDLGPTSHAERNDLLDEIEQNLDVRI
jgi:hypothetical protein